jgi:hypothetical protein
MNRRRDGAVGQRDPEIHDRVPRQPAALGGFPDSLLDGRTEVLRNRSAEDLVDELEPAAARQGLQFDPAVPELPAPSGLFLVTPLDGGDSSLDRFEIGHFGLL